MSKIIFNIKSDNIMRADVRKNSREISTVSWCHVISLCKLARCKNQKKNIYIWHLYLTFISGMWFPYVNWQVYWAVYWHLWGIAPASLVVACDIQIHRIWQRVRAKTWLPEGFLPKSVVKHMILKRPVCPVSGLFVITLFLPAENAWRANKLPKLHTGSQPRRCEENS